MLYYMESFLIVAFEILCGKIFYESFAEKREKQNQLKNIGIIVGLIVSAYFIAAFLSAYFLIKEIMIILFTAVLMNRYLKLNLGKMIILSVIYQGLLIMIDYLSFVVCEPVLSMVFDIEMTFEIPRHIVVIIGKVVLFLTVLLIRKRMGRDMSGVMLNVDWRRMIFFPILSICMIAALLAMMRNPDDRRQELGLLVIALGMAGMNIVIFLMITDILRREAKLRESRIFQLEVKNQTGMYRSISENYADQRKKTHEYKNQILCIGSLLRKKVYDDLEEYVGGLSEHLSEESNYISTNHIIVDAILNTKHQEMIKQNILFVFLLDDLSNIKISDEDIVIILANLLDNAIEACMQCQGKRVIRLKFVIEEDAVIISMKNNYEGEILYDGTEIRSSKADHAEEHCFGIKNIAEAIRKYGGSYSIQTKEKEFFFSILIPCESEQASMV